MNKQLYIKPETIRHKVSIHLCQEVVSTKGTGSGYTEGDVSQDPYGESAGFRTSDFGEDANLDTSIW